MPVLLQKTSKSSSSGKGIKIKVTQNNSMYQVIELRNKHFFFLLTKGRLDQF
jgi:hypothetical protein